MQVARICLMLGFCFIGPAWADLTIVQKVEGMGALGRPGGAGGSSSEITVRIKGDRARIDATPEMSTIVDGKTGEVLTLMISQKKVIRISAEKMKAASEMINQYNDKKTAVATAKPQATGRKETINGYEAEEYTMDTPHFKAAYWLAPKFPNGAAVLQQLREVKSDIWKSSNRNVPDYRDFPALPIKTVVDMGTIKVTTTLVSVKQDPLNEADFDVPKDFQEVKTPDLSGMLPPAKAGTNEKASPHP